jgi:stringent starvation protein B
MGQSDMPAEPPLPPKKAVAMALLQGPSMLVHLDPRREGVVVPPHFRRQPQLVLQFGLNLAVPIRDLDVNEEGLSGTLSFNRSPCWCYLPWSAVYALVGEDGRGMVWPDDVPPEIAAGAQRAADARPAPAKKPRKRARIRAVGADDAPAAEAQGELREGAKASEAAVAGDGSPPEASEAEPDSSNEPAYEGNAATSRSEHAPLRAGPRLVPASPAPDASKDGRPSEPPKAGRKLPSYLRVIK